MWLICLCLAGCWASFLWFSDAGYGLRDDSFYLIWASDPFAYTRALTDFGYFWHPLYRLVGGDIASFRVAGLLVLGSSASCFAFALTRFAADQLRASMTRASLVAAVLASAFWEYLLWAPTPSYNSLNLDGLLLFYAGLLLVAAPPRSDLRDAPQDYRKALVTGILTGLGLFLTIMAKPTTSLAAIFIGITWLVLLRPRRAFVFFLTTAAVTMLSMSAVILVVYGGFGAFVNGKLAAARLVGTIAGNAYFRLVMNSVVEIVAIRGRFRQLTEFLANDVVVIAVGLLWAHTLVTPRRPGNGSRRIVVYGAPLVLMAWVVWARASGRSEPGLVHHAFYAMEICELLLLAAMTATMIRAAGGLGDAKLRRVLRAAGLMAAGPFACAFGSGVPVIVLVGTAAVFWAAAMLLVAAIAPSELRDRAVLATGLLCSTLALGLWIGVWVDPGVLGVSSLWKETEPIVVGPRNAVVHASPDTAQLIWTLRRAADRNLFESGTPIIDLTGTAPGIVFALGGNAPGTPWLTADQWDNLAYVRALFATVPAAELRRAWMLSPPLDGRGAAFSALISVGLRFPDDYELVARAQIPGDDVSSFDYLFWKPRPTSGAN